MRYQTALTAKCSAETGGGILRTEAKGCRDIESMFRRLIMTGEMAKAKALRTNRSISKDQTVRLMSVAKEAPQYMRDGEKQEILKDMKEAGKILKETKAKKARDKIYNEAFENGKKAGLEEGKVSSGGEE